MLLLKPKEPNVWVWLFGSEPSASISISKDDGQNIWELEYHLNLFFEEGKGRVYTPS